MQPCCSPAKQRVRAVSSHTNMNLSEKVKERSEEPYWIHPAWDQWPRSLQMKSKLTSSLSSTVTHVREQIEAEIEQEVKGKVMSDF